MGFDFLPLTCYKSCSEALQMHCFIVKYFFLDILNIVYIMPSIKFGIPLFTSCLSDKFVLLVTDFVYFGYSQMCTWLHVVTELYITELDDKEQLWRLVCRISEYPSAYIALIIVYHIQEKSMNCAHKNVVKHKLKDENRQCFCF